MLDGLRLLAALAVVAYHYVGGSREFETPVWGTPTSELFPSVAPAAHYGWMGVQLFFLISGFVICMSGWGKSAVAFMRGRAVRLYPMFWFAVLLTAAVFAFLPHPIVTGSPATLRTVLTNLTMAPQPLSTPYLDVPYWTLWVELRFYLIFAVVVWQGLTYRRVANFCWIWMTAVIFAPSSGIPLLQTITDAQYAPFFISGMIFYLIHRFGAGTLESWALLAASWLLMQHQIMGVVSLYGRPSNFAFYCAAFTAMYAMMLVVALGWTDRIRWRWLPVAGALTYPLYLLHVSLGTNIIHKLRVHTSMSPWAVLGTVLAIMFVLSWLAHLWIERPSAKLVRRLSALGNHRPVRSRPGPEQSGPEQPRPEESRPEQLTTS